MIFRGFVRATTFIFTHAHKQAYLSKLTPDSFTEDELRDYYHESSDESEPDDGKMMLDALRALHQSLEALHADSVIVFTIG